MAYSEIRHFSNLVDQLPFVADELTSKQNIQKDSNKHSHNLVTNVPSSNTTTPSRMNTPADEILKNLNFSSQKFNNDSSKCEPEPNGLTGIEMQNRLSSFSRMNQTNGIKNGSINEIRIGGGEHAMFPNHVHPNMFSYGNTSMMYPNMQKLVEENTMNTNTIAMGGSTTMFENPASNNSKQRITDYLPDAMKKMYYEVMCKQSPEQMIKESEIREAQNKNMENKTNSISNKTALSGKGVSNWNCVNPKEPELKGNLMEQGFMNSFDNSLKMSFFNNTSNEPKINDEQKLFENFVSQMKTQNNLGNANMDELYKMWVVRNSDSTNASDIYNKASYLTNGNIMEKGMPCYVDKHQGTNNLTNAFNGIDSKSGDMNFYTPNNKMYGELLKKNIMPNQVLLPEKATVVHLEKDKSLVIFPLNLVNHGTKYVAVNQKELLECIVSSVEFEGEDNIQVLQIKLYQMKKELERAKLFHSLQNTHVQQLMNRMLFENMKETQLKKIIFCLEHEVTKLTEENNSLTQNSKDGFFMQKLFIDLKCKCILKLRALEPYLGIHYYEIFEHIIACRTLGQLSIWVPAFEIKEDSLQETANRLARILLRGFGAPTNICPKYFTPVQNKMPSQISSEVQCNELLKNMLREKIAEQNTLHDSSSAIKTNKENRSNLGDERGSSMRSENSSFIEQEEFYFNSFKNPSMHSAIVKNVKNDKIAEPPSNVKRSATSPESINLEKKEGELKEDITIDEQAVLEQIGPFCRKMKEKMKEHKGTKHVFEETETQKNHVKKMRTFKMAKNGIQENAISSNVRSRRKSNDKTSF